MQHLSAIQKLLWPLSTQASLSTASFKGHHCLNFYSNYFLALKQFFTQICIAKGLLFLPCSFLKCEFFKATLLSLCFLMMCLWKNPGHWTCRVFLQSGIFNCTEGSSTCCSVLCILWEMDLNTGSNWVFLWKNYG